MLQLQKESEAMQNSSKGGSKSQTLTPYNQPAIPPDLMG